MLTAPIAGPKAARPTVCLLSHAYLEKRYRGKLAFLAQKVDLTLIAPERFRFPYGVYTADFSEARAYDVMLRPCRFPLGIRTSTRWVLASRDLGFGTLRPDVVHVENELHSFSLLQALLCRRLYAPRARTIAFFWSNSTLPGIRGRVLDAVTRMTRTHIDHYVAGNRDAKRWLSTSGVDEARISVFPQIGVDIDYYRPLAAAERAQRRAEMGFAAHDFVVGFVGRLVEEKGIPDLVDAIGRVRQANAGASVRLLCVGDGPLKSKLIAECAGAIVSSPGDSGRVRPYYQVMDALVLPSRTVPRWKEQFGLALVEAMACGVPVVGSSSGAIPEVVGDAGSVFRERNVEHLAALLSALLESPARRSAYSEAGRARAATEFSGERIARQTYETYCQVLSIETVSR